MPLNPVWTRRSAEIALVVTTQVAVYFAVKWIIDTLDDNRSRKSKAQQILAKMGKADMELTTHEKIVASGIILPDEIEVGFDDIGGLDPIIRSLKETVIFPLLYPNLFASSSDLLNAPKGVLLYGPPGCGKTMLAKALAKESGATFINLAVSTIANKWYGESNQLVLGLFGLARKLQPCIIFMDEIDAFLRERSRGDHEATAQLKAEFMALWDGLLSGGDRILVLGATNRPADIDAAMLRRMPARYAVGLPGAAQRELILGLMLRGTRTDGFALADLAERMEGFSGSDMQEACRAAAMVPVREYLQAQGRDPAKLRRDQAAGVRLRPLSLDDFAAAERYAREHAPVLDPASELENTPGDPPLVD